MRNSYTDPYLLYKMRPVTHLAAGPWGVRGGGGKEDCNQGDQEDLHLVSCAGTRELYRGTVFSPFYILNQALFTYDAATRLCIRSPGWVLSV